MGTEKSGNALNAALAQVLTDHKRDQRVTFDALVESTGIALRTLKRVFNDERAMDTDQLLTVSKALGVNSSDVLADALARLEQRNNA